MTVLTIRDLDAPYDYVVSEQVAGDVVRLLNVFPIALAATGQEMRHSILELKGLGKEIWEGVDPKKYIDELRGEGGEAVLLAPPGDRAERRQRLAQLVAWMKAHPLSDGAPKLTREDFHERR